LIIWLIVNTIFDYRNKLADGNYIWRLLISHEGLILTWNIIRLPNNSVYSFFKNQQFTYDNRYYNRVTLKNEFNSNMSRQHSHILRG
jgi:hypothetical protein